MHDSAMENGKRFFNAYVRKNPSATVLDIGSQDVNGSLRQFCQYGAKYVGVDFVAGNGVDVILEDPYKLPFDSHSIDAVVSSSCFEHSEMFWIIYLEILRVLKPQGVFYLNVPFNGPVHRYPVDCWRFYPDSGHALVRWAELNSYRPAVLESYVSNQMLECWNDFVCVFVKDREHAKNHPKRILDDFSDFTNGYRIGDSKRLNEVETTEDQSKFGWRMHKKIQQEIMKRT